ncbi:hypothetical protein LTR37_014271 [Vermiconidia calcicola]|uniref:Uncharacterized protein n=1 Tax=Vermiconidia calcicola TaxID=1690605 RepID=A0ACC3MTW6_9PEZI|nr:hypothetical protein LTR37_014271 [Vermiconidia calcicola]
MRTQWHEVHLIWPATPRCYHARHTSPRLCTHVIRPAGTQRLYIHWRILFPYSSSIWDTSRFFAITIPFTLWQSGTSDCRTGPGATGSDSPDCHGNTFTHVKVMDIAWDVLVGRGGQAVLILCAYRLFGRVIKMLMQQGEVGYDVFSAVAFNTGGVESFLTLARHFAMAPALQPIPRTRRTLWAYSGMAVATMYIIAMPSLIASMTGYTSHYAPFLDYSNMMSGNDSHRSPQDCFGAIQPVWGRVQAIRSEPGGLWKPPFEFEVWSSDSSLPEYQPILEDGVLLNQVSAPKYMDYYHRYRSVYDVCASKLNISDCAEADRTTYLLQLWVSDEETGWVNTTILPPMPGIVPYQSVSTPLSESLHWICSDEEFQKSDLGQVDEYDNPVGLAVICRAGTGFVWGFSFLLSFMVCSMNLIFVLIMYALWVGTLRHPVPSAAVSHFKDAAIMISSAQKEYGVDCAEWDAKDLKRIVVRGNVGMRSAEEDH